jgi:hypothetical protein
MVRREGKNQASRSFPITSRPKSFILQILISKFFDMRNLLAISC